MNDFRRSGEEKVPSNNFFKCIITALNYDDNILFIRTQDKLKLPCFNLYGEVSQKKLSQEFTNLTSYSVNRNFMLLAEIKIQKEKYYVYAIVDGFPNPKNHVLVFKDLKVLTEEKIENKMTYAALEILKKNRFEQKNFNEIVVQQDKEAKKRLKNVQNNLLTDEDKDYIKKYYLGRQQFMAFYSDFRLSRLMSGLLQAKSGSLLEPSCGSGRLLEYLDRDNLRITCYEIDPQSAKVCSILYPEVNVICGDALDNLEQIEGKFDFVLCSSPWGLYVGKLENYILTSRLGGEDSTFYFSELAIRSLRDGGKGILFLPTSIFRMEQYKEFCNLVGEWGKILLRVDLPSECCSSSNIIIDCTMLIFIRKYNSVNDFNEFTHIKISKEEWEEFITEKSETLINKLLYCLSNSDY